jgi:outer membrane receptor protein involved in Fe transport
MAKKIFWLTGVALVAVSHQARAQDDQTGNDNAANNDNVIIVTATRRASDVQDIPIAVTAVTPAQLDQQGITNIQTLGAVAPSFNIQSSQTESQGTSIRIRGVGTTGNNIGLESAVGVFIDAAA